MRNVITVTPRPFTNRRIFDVGLADNDGVVFGTIEHTSIGYAVNLERDEVVYVPCFEDAVRFTEERLAFA